MNKSNKSFRPLGALFGLAAGGDVTVGVFNRVAPPSAAKAGADFTTIGAVEDQRGSALKTQKQAVRCCTHFTFDPV